MIPVPVQVQAAKKLQTLIQSDIDNRTYSTNEKTFHSKSLENIPSEVIEKTKTIFLSNRKECEITRDGRIAITLEKEITPNKDILLEAVSYDWVGKTEEKQAELLSDYLLEDIEKTSQNPDTQFQYKSPSLKMFSDQVIQMSRKNLMTKWSEKQKTHSIKNITILSSRQDFPQLLINLRQIPLV